MVFRKYNATLFGPLRIIFIKIVIFLRVNHDPNDPISTHVNDKRMQTSKSTHQISPALGVQKLVTFCNTHVGTITRYIRPYVGTIQ